MDGLEATCAAAADVEDAQRALEAALREEHAAALAAVAKTAAEKAESTKLDFLQVDLPSFWRDRLPEVEGKAKDAAREAAANEASLIVRRFTEEEKRRRKADRKRLAEWPALRERYRAETQSYRVREREIAVENHSETLSRTKLAKVAVPQTEDWGEILRYRRLENLPGAFPFTAGVFPFKRSGEDPARMFAGEGTPERTNRRFHLVSEGQPAARLSTAFDSVTLYGRDPGPRPDVYGKVGNSGVSVSTVDDAKKLRRGFAALPLPALGDQKQQALDLELARPGGQGGRPAFLRATAQFQYSKVVPIKAEITAKLEEQRRLHRDVTNLQIGRDVEYEDDWDFPDRQGTEDAKEADDDDGGAGA